MAFRREGGTGIRYADRPVAAVGRVPDRMVDALIGEQTGDDQMLDPEIAGADSRSLVELKRLDEVFASTMSSSAGAIASTTLASREPFATKIPEIL